ncbi:MAG TPA: hypothetical protein VLM89_16930 [Phycisphaerae bacterium]|nr:hypothetical protein [Phycisphaerae bacterium]
MSRLSTFLWVMFFVLVGHIWSVDTGLYLDDHAHFQHLQRGDWSFKAVVEASRLGIIGQVIDLWGRKEDGLLFFRPIAFWIMKLEYTLVRWNPLGMHLFVVGWHLLCSLLVVTLALRCFGRRSWATVAGCIHAIHPGHTATVYWVACQTELLTTFFLLTGVLAYARHAGWTRGAFTLHPNPPDIPPDAASRLRRITPSAVVSILCYALALGCRENAVLFPAVCWLGDRLFSPARRGWLRWEHVAMGCVLVVYFLLRYQMLGGFPLPSKPYLVPLSDPEFPRYMLDKAAIYLIGLFLFVPVVPVGGQVFFTEHPFILYGLAGAVVLIGLIVRPAYGQRKAILWPLAWMACFLAPVMPVFASSHHLYLPGVGAALLMTAGLAALYGLPRIRRAMQPSDSVRARAGAKSLSQNPCGTGFQPVGFQGSETGSETLSACATDGSIPQPTSRGRRWACAIAMVAFGGTLILLTWAQAFSYNRGTMVEDMVIEDVARGRPLRDGDHLFFINMPMVAYYTVPALETKLGLKNLHGHALTFTPDLLGMPGPGQLEVLDDRRFRVRCCEGHSYFEGITGHMLLDILKLRGQIKTDQPIEAGNFTVTPTDVDDNEGIRELLFEFQQPLDSTTFHFYFGSPRFMAYPVNLATLPSARQ